MHLLTFDPDLVKLLPGYDLYMFDKHSWHCILGLLNLFADTKFFNGLADGCLLPYVNEVKFAWTLHHNMKHNSSDNNCDFQWCLIPPAFEHLLISYATCKSLHMGYVFCTSQATGDTDPVRKIKLVLALSEDLEFYSTVCMNLSSNASAGTALSSKKVCRLPNSTQYQSSEQPVSTITLGSIWSCESKNVLQTKALSSVNTSTKPEEICASSDIKLSDADVLENDLKWVKTELVTDDEKDAQDGKQHCSHMLQFTKIKSGRDLDRKVLHENVYQVAKTYASLVCSKDYRHASHPFPPIKGKGRRIILECPGCNIPSSCTSSSAFFKLLCHVKRRHSAQSNELIVDIVERYSNLLERMCMKIAKRNEQFLKTW